MSYDLIFLLEEPSMKNVLDVLLPKLRVPTPEHGNQANPSFLSAVVQNFHTSGTTTKVLYPRQKPAATPA